MLGFLKSSIVVVVAFISITARGNELLTCEYKVQDTYAYFQKNFPSLIVSGEKSLSLEEFSSLKQIMIGNLGFSDEDIPYICSLTQIE